ncbi:zinc-dependent alcohol dehydrogenase [Herbiconiux ginsengi]|uniref:(R,R)-butanediol dehydrogenase / meso-butanediol dehydrogenase / diacetyl reductase n=1 Tax=Herbiconiux ginsengi TaxID=381665 RepID=A0A1H3QQ03_9MICO|nr:alcohol dehydrogenase catalytic domain-containing protein [Herbiconiux ginsengi]SDZ15131.1 (R,R)-butanediol dehydrogenase / meso-butanediol dehydrogenase / diacetyl reductase [Herbiconiux ginsengi]
MSGSTSETMSGTMTAAVFRGAHDVSVESRAVPVPGPGEVLLRVSASGICGTDSAEYASGPHLAPREADGTARELVLGHEFVGTVVERGPGVEGFPIGAVAVCGAGISCGRCVMCRAGRTNVCRSYHSLGLQNDGGLAQFVAAPAAILYDASGSGLSADTLALAQPMAVAVHAVRRSALHAGQDAVVIGAGGIGAFLGYVAAATGARVLVLDLDPARLDLAERLGASHTALASGAPLGELLETLGYEPEVFFEVSGSRQGLESIFAAAAPGAVIVPVGIQKGRTELDLARFTLAEFTLVGTVAHVVADDLPEAVRLLGARAEGWNDIAAEVLPLAQLVERGLEPLAAGRSTQIKTLIDPWIDAPRPARHELQEALR